MPSVHKDNQNKKSFQVPVKTKANAPKNYNTHWLQYVHTKLNSLSFISSTFASEFKPAESISSAPITGFQVPTTAPLFFFVAVKNVKSIWLLWLLKNAITRRPSGSREDAYSFIHVPVICTVSLSMTCVSMPFAKDEKPQDTITEMFL